MWVGNGNTSQPLHTNCRQINITIHANVAIDRANRQDCQLGIVIARSKAAIFGPRPLCTGSVGGTGRRNGIVPVFFTERLQIPNIVLLFISWWLTTTTATITTLIIIKSLMMNTSSMSWNHFP